MEPQRWTRCPVCEGEQLEPYVAFEELAFERCAACGTVFKTREAASLRPADFYEQSYFHGRKSGRDKRFEHRVRKAIGQLRGAMEFGEVRSVLDVGCSFGYIVEAGRRLGLDAAGSDISEYAVKVCNDRGLRAKVGTLETLPFDDGEFDLVILRHVLEHTPTPKVALAQVRRVLSPGGLVLVAVPDLDYWKGQWRRESYRYFRPDDLGQQHYVYYTQRSLPRLLGAAGFQTLAETKAFPRPRHTPAAVEPFRRAAVATWQGAARLLRMRRELYMIARRDDAAAAGKTAA